MALLPALMSHASKPTSFGSSADISIVGPRGRRQSTRNVIYTLSDRVVGCSILSLVCKPTSVGLFVDISTAGPRAWRQFIQHRHAGSERALLASPVSIESKPSIIGRRTMCPISTSTCQCTLRAIVLFAVLISLESKPTSFGPLVH